MERDNHLRTGRAGRLVAAMAVGASALLMGATARAQDADRDDRPLPPGGTPVLTATAGGKPAAPIALDGPFEIAGDQPELGRASSVAVADDGPADTSKGAEADAKDAASGGVPTGRALRVVSTGNANYPYSVGVAFPTATAVKKGDTLLARFYVRAVDSTTSEAFAGVAFEKSSPEWDKSAEMQASAPTGSADGQAGPWRRIDVPFASAADYAPGEAHLAFRFGFPNQTVEVAGIEVLDYGTSVKPADLPRTKQSYEGMAADAPWRQAALDRIEQIRKGDLAVRVVGADGRPVVGATVEAKMTRHAFPFGTAVVSEAIVGDSPQDEQYRKTLLENFNAVVFENDLKWPAMTEWDDTGWGTDRPKRAAEWLREHDFLIRGHCLVWPGRENLPRSVVALENDPAALKKAVEDHVAETAAMFRGLVDQWDVVNEPFNNHFLMDVLGDGILADYFRITRENDPTARLFLNDWGILAAGNRTDTAHQQDFEDRIQALLDAGAPIGGIGMQGHFGGTLTSPENLLKIVDRYAKFGLPIYVTELDLNIPDEDLRAAYMRDFHIAMFSRPEVGGVIQWGFWSKRHWLPQAALFGDDFAPRPHGRAWMDLVHGEWQTDATATTAADGTATVRGFLGEYDVVVTPPGGAAPQTAKATLTHDGTRVEVTLGK